jgi:hypothetical protein
VTAARVGWSSGQRGQRTCGTAPASIPAPLLPSHQVSPQRARSSPCRRHLPCPPSSVRSSAACLPRCCCCCCQQAQNRQAGLRLRQ